MIKYCVSAMAMASHITLWKKYPFFKRCYTTKYCVAA